ncbi:PSD1 and planctomycete cytochrome C domain-containing protein [Prosthecobacter sp.]|uniref:PSD1 and planctomycete cytochrome C domain-containing protein n=1 Tax=Prosthecobacter sp. TaxID=1965333 RepID=UPI002AB89C9E|nr:PSD1 and planctomycete cytochrome C domain-containing protein [Prosthecobacter sp.]MDZ4405830.1 PSD1 and planctomycete cytochrome C domain-containing protein [Prosthecobacter sp.]
MKHTLSFLLVASSLHAADTAFFESKIRPVLVKHCYECHSAESGKSKGGLMLDTKHGIREGGETGPAVVPGDAAKSLLLTAIKHSDPDLEMPPKEPQLPPSVIADFETWIKAGAADPRESAVKVAERPPVDLEAGRKFWSYQKPKQVAGSIDGFIQAKLKEDGLVSAPEAEPVALLRRLYFDLIGLPPTPKEVKAFSMDKLEATVDELLKSPRFGERWGRHWLDVARFAESNGRESNLTFPHAWRYRDYVIDAVNADVPFDRFITEQIAGDLLTAKDDAERARLLVATGFLAFGPKGLNEQNKAQFAADVADEQLDTVTRAVMASSVACARCHDHKTEPFSMEDYYALAGIFKSTQTFYGNWIDSENNNHGHLIRLPEVPGQIIPNRPVSAERVKQLKSDLAKLNQKEKDQQAYALKAKLEGRDISGEFYEMLRIAIGILWTRGGLEGQLETVDDQGRALPLCMGVQDAKRIQDSQLYVRGEIAHPVKAVPRGFPRVIEVKGSVSKQQSGRLEFAQWLTSRDNPLTARVMANRVWRHLFGAGLVRTVDNFGFSGERSSHPELLDHLAIKFMDSGWSVKSLIREIVFSKTYRQASTHRTDAFEKDPDNRLLWRAPKRRLDAEVIRDSMLAVSGLLDTSRRPGSLVAELDGQSVSLIGFNTKLPPDLDGSKRRSIYLPVLRDNLPDVLEQFDVANPNLVTGDRDVTNVPLQALYLMNGPFVQEQAAALAQRVMKEKLNLPERIRRAFALCFNRAPDAKEQQLAESFFQTAAGDETKLMTAYCHALLSSAEFRFAD